MRAAGIGYAIASRSSKIPIGTLVSRQSMRSMADLGGIWHAGMAGALAGSC